MNIRTRFNSNLLLLGVVFIGVGLRLLVSSLGHNYDLDSFRIVAEIVGRGGNVYAETARYNYGPVWFGILGAFDWGAGLSGGNREAMFRVVLVCFLTLVDLGIAWALLREKGRLVACLFFLNPISILITGYHNQFDNLALLLGFGAVMVMQDRFEERVDRRKLLGLGLLGLSLMTKHILFAFPLWLAVKQKGWEQKALVLAVPVVIFGLGFLPFWGEGQSGIIENVFLYDSRHNQIFYRLFIPVLIRPILSSSILWLAMLVVFAFLYRRKRVFENLLFYTCVLTAFSPAIANQYLVIPLPFLSVFPNLISLAYTGLGTVHLLNDNDGLHLEIVRQILGLGRNPFYAAMVTLLLMQLGWLEWGERIVQLSQVAWKRVNSVRSGHDVNYE